MTGGRRNPHPPVRAGRGGSDRTEADVRAGAAMPGLGGSCALGAWFPAETRRQADASRSPPSRPSIDLPPTDYKRPSRTRVRNSVVWCPTSALRSSARTGTGWDHAGWSWAGHRVPAQQRCAPREPPDIAPICASSAMRRSSFPRTPGHRSPGCSGRRDRRTSSRGPARQRSKPAGSQTRRPARIQNISIAEIMV